MPMLSLDCLTLTDTSPTTLIRAADAAGFDLVSLWVHPPATYPRALVSDEAARDCARLFADTRVRAHGLEVFDLVDEAGIEAARPALARGAALGGRAAVAINAVNPDRGAVVALLARFAAVAGEYGLGVNVEPIAMGRTRTLRDACDLVRDAGVDAGVTLDTLHFVRTGSVVADIAPDDARMIRHVQVNDGPATIAREDRISEAVAERLYPGDGVFPLVALLRAVPFDVPWAVECPSLRRATAGRSATEQAVEAMAALRRLIAAVRPDAAGDGR